MSEPLDGEVLAGKRRRYGVGADRKLQAATSLIELRPASALVVALFPGCEPPRALPQLFVLGM